MSDTDDGLGLFGHDDTLNEETLPGISTTKGEVLLMVMAYAMRHCLSSVGIVHLLELINEIMGRSVLPASKYLFQKVFRRKSVHLSFHFYCSFCLSFLCTYYEHAEENIECPQCGTPCDTGKLSGDNYFITSSVGPQLKCLLERPDITKHIDYRFTRQKINEDSYEDIYDGEIYKELSKEGNPLNNVNNFSYSFNSDGVPLFSSSKYSMWPIFVMLNELPHKLREENLILAGVWCGKSKPKMEVFLQKFVDEAKELATTGIQWKKNGVETHSKIFGLCCCVDAPARASMQNTMQFNGYYGCSLCYHPGKICNGVVKYPVDVVAHSDREEDEMLSDMIKAVDENRIVRGVKGPTPLANIPHFPVVWGFPPDFMHCCLLGVTRQLAELWLSSPAGEDHYIGSTANIDLLNKRLNNIQPPNVIIRTPRPISERKYWKAIEWHNWLLFFGLPCLLGILPHQYLHHFCILVRAMSILLQKSISPEDGNSADMLMTAFVGEFQMLYGTSSMTFNVHSLLHLPKSVLKWGPLWTHSCFPFESSNGKVKRLLHGSKGIALQAMHKLMLLKALPLFGHMYNISNRVNRKCNDMLRLHENPFAPEGIKLLGAAHVVQFTESESNAFIENGYHVNETAECYTRIKKNGFTFHTVGYSRPTARNNKYFSLDDGTSGELHRIIMHNEQCLILFKPLILRNVKEFEHPGSGAFVRHIRQWTGVEESFQVTTADLLFSSCIVVTLPRKSYVCFLPNHCVL